ncbi:MAG TPA: helix-turn-helix domain-containing protein [Nocardioides sp.]|uniref:helix-turn-helix domain-containing protein n=1 Tax=Nocardioides sp. TaxID=35761 RepID=UPI002D80EFAC|nr:helix-turn-helix domain-containing protein [Nocardioides sp.]HET6654424.1 helix-turn-helix domain-containing protein [Nocardioides sp.]
MSLEQRGDVGVRLWGSDVERTVFDPARVLGCSLEQARRLMRGRVVTPGEVESVALGAYRWRAHLRDPESYWVTVSQAADILGVSVVELRRLLSQRRLPFFTHKSGVRLMRRQQIQEIARHRPHGRHMARTLSAG